MKTKKHIYLDKQALRDLELKHGVKGMGCYFDLSLNSGTHLKVSPLMLFSLAEFFESYPDSKPAFTDADSTIWKGLCSEVNSDNTSVKLAEFKDDNENDAHYKIFSEALRRIYNANSTDFSLYLSGKPDLLSRPTIDNKAEYRNHPIFSDLFLAWILIGDDDEKKKEFTVRYFKKIKDLASSNKEAMLELRESGSNPYNTPMGALGTSHRSICQESDCVESPFRDMRKLLEGKKKEITKETVGVYQGTREVDKITYEDFGNKISPYTLEKLVDVFQEHITKARGHDYNQASDKQRRFDDNKRYLLGLTVARALGVLTCNSLHAEAWSPNGIKLALNAGTVLLTMQMCNHEDMKSVDKKNNVMLMSCFAIMSCFSAIYLYECIHSFDSKPAIAIRSLLLAANLYVSCDQAKAVYEDYVGRS